jgi:hypothetical protein
MKCPHCDVDNKDQAKMCRKCGQNLQLPPLWQPTWKWHRKTLIIIYIALIALFFGLKYIMKPFVRELPPEITPWMHEKGRSDASAK